MTTLGCSVMNCTYNQNYLCCRPDIKVSGPNASVANQTCCASFQDATGGAQNSASYVLPNTSLEIYCSARNCTFNQNEHCDAQRISIQSEGAYANEESETKCGSFRHK